jgi:hypothetical protein
MVGFDIGVSVRTPQRFISKHFLVTASGYECGFYCHSGTAWVRIFSRWYRRHVRYAIGCVPIPGSLHGGSSESTTQVAVIIGEIIGHFLNDAIMRITTRRNGGVFEAESRLW